jgi:glycosyltransferase 2 family protein
MFYLAGTSVGLHIPMLAWLGVVPIILAASAVPITIAGIGVREYLLVLFLGVLANINGEKALAASLITFSMMLAVCLAGGIVYIFYRPREALIKSHEGR